LMNRTYTIEHYLNLIDKARKIIQGVSFSTDIISGFPTETKEDHEMTLEVTKRVRYDGAYMFKYSPRGNTKAYRMEDDVSEEEKTRRLSEIIDLQQKISYEVNREIIGNDEIVLVEGNSRKSDEFLAGRTGTNKVVIFPKTENVQKGNYVKVKISRATSATLFAEEASKIEIDKAEEQIHQTA